jgi:hypothetical protein
MHPRRMQIADMTFLPRALLQLKALAVEPSHTQLAVLLLMFLVPPTLPIPRYLTMDTSGKLNGGHRVLLLLILMEIGCQVSQQSLFRAYYNNLSDHIFLLIVSACSGGSSSNSTTTVSKTTTTKATTTTTTAASTTTSSATTTSKTTTASATPTGSGTNCSGVSAWSSSVAYVGGSKVTYNGHLLTAKWWTQAETPSSTSSVWVDGGACSSTSKRKRHSYGRRRL